MSVNGYTLNAYLKSINSTLRSPANVMISNDGYGNLSINWEGNTPLIDIPTLTTWAAANPTLVTTEQTTESQAIKIARLTSLGLYRAISQLASLAGQSPAAFLATYLD